jgi:tetratricopeptide (TPR) repeat protein
MTPSPSHHYAGATSAATTVEPAPANGALPAPPQAAIDVSCHRSLRGPFTGGGALLRRIVPDVLAHDPDMVTFRAVEITAVAPELATLVPHAPQTLTNLAVRDERTRFYHASRALRIAHGIAELLMDWVRLTKSEGIVIAFRDLDDADPTDRDLVAVLLRRCDPSLMTVIAEGGAGTDDLLGEAVVAYAQPAGPLDHAQPESAPGADLAQLFIASDGTSRDPGQLAAYEALDAEERARRHTARADELVALGEPSLIFGAIPYHRERGTDPLGVGAEAFVAGVNGCFATGFYEAALDLAVRGRRLIEGSDQVARYWGFTHKMAACLTYLGRGRVAMGYLDEMRGGSIDAETHMGVSYLLAMLYTRFLPPEDHDEAVALAWVNTAIALADNLPDLSRRPFVRAFMRNARALVELHRGGPSTALALVEEAIGITESELGPDEQLLHRSVLLYNQAQVHAALQNHTASVLEYDELVRRDPDYGDYYFERAAGLRALGRTDEALSDYASAIRLCAPFFEAHYNRADLLRELGDDEAALRDLDYALDIEPAHVDSLLARADLMMARGEAERALADIERGLAAHPGDANLLTARGTLLEEAGDAESAYADFTAALDHDETFAAAWANRAVLSYSAGRLAEAVEDLDHAIELTDDASLRANRAVALQDLGEHRRALLDLDLAVEVLAEDDPDLLYRRGASRYALQDVDGARTDWRAHLSAYEGVGEQSPFLDRISLRDGESAGPAKIAETVG